MAHIIEQPDGSFLLEMDSVDVAKIILQYEGPTDLSPSKAFLVLTGYSYFLRAEEDDGGRPKYVRFLKFTTWSEVLEFKLKWL